MGYRPNWWPKIDGCGPRDVLELAQTLHEHTTGASDCLDDKKTNNIERCLRWVRDNWKQPTYAFDSAVLMVIIQAINEREQSRRK